MAKKVLCLCSKCRKKTVIENGQTLPGQNIDSALRNIHEAHDNLAESESDAGVQDHVPVIVAPAREADNSRITVPTLDVFQKAIAPVTTLCVMLAAWLNLHVGVGRENSSIFLKALRFIMLTVINLIFGVLQLVDPKIQSPTLDIPQDIRSVYQHGLEPEIIRTPCCPTCYKNYSLANLPEICGWKKSPKSRACGTVLWKQVRTQNGTTKSVPKSFYSTQSFESWLRFFLGRSQVEEQLEKSFQADQTRQNAPQADIMKDIQDSPAWRGLGNYLLSRYHLVFGFYIDWFNPYTNKIAGKVVSCGAIVLYCLSLPIEVRFL
ncbi:hypothetical protein DFH09DRAFT_1287640, partial [Mycena vulgaris]